MKQNVCRKYKYGHCKYGDKCHFRHVKQICVDKNCNVFACEKRHPKICNFFSEFGQCKFTTYCDYKHEKHNSAKENSEKIKLIEKKITEVENKVLNKDIITKLEAIENEFENKIKTFENQLIKLKDVIEVKDDKISVLENKVREIENKFTDFVNNEDTLKKKRKKKTFECPNCDFISSSEKGLRIHKTRVHTDSTNTGKDKFPKTCDLCDYDVNNKSELTQHLKTHSYKAVNFQCRECEYFGESELEMEVHIGKKHSDQFDCGICDLEIKSLENLKIHLSTCEIYKCDCCGKKVATLKEIKTHMETEHPENKQHLYVIHLKQNRSDCEVIDEKLHNTTELFPEFLRK